MQGNEHPTAEGESADDAGQRLTCSKLSRAVAEDNNHKLRDSTLSTGPAEFTNILDT